MTHKALLINIVLFSVISRWEGVRERERDYHYHCSNNKHNNTDITIATTSNTKAHQNRQAAQLWAEANSIRNLSTSNSRKCRQVS
jgi:hypothetical protein